MYVRNTRHYFSWLASPSALEKEAINNDSDEGRRALHTMVGAAMIPGTLARCSRRWWGQVPRQGEDGTTTRVLVGGIGTVRYREGKEYLRAGLCERERERERQRRRYIVKWWLI